jgi:hypothetical protein
MAPDLFQPYHAVRGPVAAPPFPAWPTATALIGR